MSHLTVAASEATFVRIFNAFRDRFRFAKADSGNFGRFSAGYNIEFHLAGGTLDLRSDNTIQVKELDIKWDRLDLSIGFDIPEVCVGGWCIIPSPWGCVLRMPRFCVFSGNPDINVTLPLGGFTSEVSITGSLVTRQFLNPDRPMGMDDWEAHEAVPSLAHEWRLFLDPQFLDIDPIDVADTVGDMLERAVKAVIDNLLDWLPDWAKDMIWGILGPVIDLIRFILDIPDDIQEWISDLLNISFGLLDLIAQFIADYFAKRTPLYKMENPYPIMPAAPNPNGSGPVLVPILLPIDKLDVFNTDLELVLEGTIG